MHKIRSETLGRRWASTKSLAKSLAESLTKSLAETLIAETDYMHGSPQDSLRDPFFFTRALISDEFKSSYTTDF